MTAAFKVIEVSGTPYEIGRAHGSLGKKEVLNSIKTYKNMFQTYGSLDWSTAKKRSRQYIKPIQDFDLDLMEEIRGVADGASVSLEDILALNARSEVIMMKSTPMLPEDGCTAFAITPAASRQGHTLLAQNWDWKKEQIDSILVLKITQPGKPSVTMVTEGGIIGKVGFNDAGIGVCLNALGTVGNPSGLPLHIVLRGILNSQKLSDAIGRINQLPNACAANYLLASANGEAIDVEKSPTDFDVLYPENGILTHTNHFLTARMRSADTTRFMAPDTFIRYGIAKQKSQQARGKVDEKTLAKILRCHLDQPDSICRHEDPLDEKAHRICTVFSLIMNLTKGKMLLLRGNPCEHKYEKV